ncbi:MAG: prolipoprotein diacylglyceryl transferase [Brevinematia bacterium]
MDPIVLPIFEKYIFKINLFGIEIGATWYGMMYAIGFLTGYLILLYWSKTKKIKLSYDDILDIVFVVFLGVIIGGRLGYVIFYNLPYYLSNPHKILAVWEGGMSFHGGLLGVLISIIIYSNAKKYNPFDILDLISILVPIGLGLGRIGNFINQELYGRVAENIPWAMVFPTDPQKLPRHPSQLYESFFEGLVLLIILFSTVNKKLPIGIRSSLFAIFYAIFRIFIEFFREPDAHIGYILGFLTTGQILSIILLIAGLWAFIYFKKQNIPSKIMVYDNKPRK